MKDPVLVSACLLGIPCRFDGASKPCPAVQMLEKEFKLIAVCPEVLGGLDTPRIPCEINGERVIRKDGADMTASYKIGAQKTLEVAQKNRVICAVFKEKSPSCGKNFRYDGTFTKKLICAPGVTTALLFENKIPVLSEDELTDPGIILKTVKK